MQRNLGTTLMYIKISRMHPISPERFICASDPENRPIQKPSLKDDGAMQAVVVHLSKDDAFKKGNALLFSYKLICK